ncbi:ena/VASP-like protein isoform X1 [Sinocyclocheilus rhinocerous]|uniref:ena/VASP-like protein isoform X1 n=1 Tax=Sinocyclocheilus rhinocerous TaxID=307959 RepID=UPI0007B7B566|nr:PREDICTED: ena/VASP-like protein isoform X1 [Sinocyclocheilus rhinocerous]
MEEMNALLARRRKAVDEKKDGESQSDDPACRGQNAADGVKKPWDRANSAERSSLVSRSNTTQSRFSQSTNLLDSYRTLGESSARNDRSVLTSALNTKEDIMKNVGNQAL